MPNIIIKQLMNNEINFDCFKKWISSQDNRTCFKCSRSDFLTYFLNFIHEEINIEKKFGNDCPKSTPQKIKTPTGEPILKMKEPSSLDKSFSYLSSRKSLEKSFADNSCKSNPSTPNTSKVFSTSELATSCRSPVSTLSKESSFTTPKYKKQSICLGDFLVKSAKKKSTTKSICDDSNKRITPTSLNHVQMNGSFASSNSFNDFNNTKEISYIDRNSNGLFLAKERLKAKKKLDDDITFTSKEVCVNKQIEPQLHFVSSKKQLNILSDIYIFLLRNNLVLNITAEIYFLISLLIVEKSILDSIEKCYLGVDILKDEEICNVDPKNSSEYFKTVPNVLYFTVRCLESMFDVLKYYDKSTLKFLSLNKRLKEFSSKFSERLGRLSEKKSERIIETLERRTNVCYNLDTDTKSNFPSEICFLAFRKQRDFFYEILRIWEKKHLLGGWNFHDSLGGKIRSLLCLQGDPSNFMHFAKLFKAQLIMSCGTAEMKEGLTDEDPFPCNFPTIDPEKLSRLKNRLVTKQSSNGLNSPPNFFGYQEFYKEFILVATNHNFIIHLHDIFIAEVIKLNGVTFDLAGLEESDMDVDSNTRNSFFMNIRHLRVLGKFLGFLESIPYKSEVNNFPENILTCHVKIREKKTPPLDVKHLLLSSVKNNTMILTIPWLVKYLSMLDYITLRLPYYLSLYEVLFQIYQSYGKASKKTDYNNALIQFSLGWLFDLPNFPHTEYSRLCTSKSVDFTRTCNSLDDIAIVDQNILYFCCPYLDEIKKILTNSIGNCTITVKHITPVTTVESSEQISKKRLEQQLEEAFFNGQPESIRKTVEFVSERLASACVKHICNTIVPPFKKEAIKQNKTFLQNQKQNMQVTSPVRDRNHKTVIRIKMSQLAQENLSNLHEKCAAEISTVLRERLPISIESLLAIDTLPQTKTTCISIASRMCKERLKQWINCHVTISIFTKDFEKELNKMCLSDHNKIEEEKFIFSLPSNGRTEYHNEESLSAFHLLEKIKTISVDILDNSKNVITEAILDIAVEANITLTTRCDVNDIITANICNCLVDLTLLIIAQRPDFMPQDNLWKLLIKIWRWYSETKDNLFNDLLSSRNTTLMNESTNQRESWKAFAEFVALLIKENVIHCDNFENQCISFFRKEWEQDVVNNVCYFMQQFVKIFENKNNCSKFTMLLEFLSEFCSDI